MRRHLLPLLLASCLLGATGGSISAQIGLGRVPTGLFRMSNGDGLRLLRQGDSRSAAAVFQENFEANPSDVVARYGLGVALGQLGRHGEAFAHLEAVLQTTPDFDDARYARAALLEKLGSEDGAVQDFRELCRRGQRESCEQLRRIARAWEKKGLHHYKSTGANFYQVWKYFDRAVSIDPTYPDAYFNRGLANERLHRNEAAIRDYQSYLRVRAVPGTREGECEVAKGYFRLGKVLRKQGRRSGQAGPTGAAVEAFRNAVRYAKQGGAASKDLVTYSFHLAEALNHLGGRRRREEARQALSEACALGDSMSCLNEENLAAELGHPR